MDDWIKKLWYIYYKGIPLSHKKEGDLTLVITWMDLENIMLSEVSQSEEDKYMISLTGGI